MVHLSLQVVQLWIEMILQIVRSDQTFHSDQSLSVFLASYMSTSLSTRREKVNVSNHNNHRIDEEQENETINDEYESKEICC